MSEQEKIKVLIIDDHDMVRQGLRILLEVFDDFEVVADSDDAQMILSLCTAYQPDVVLMDLLMPRVSGVEATKLIRDNFPNIQVVALTSSIENTLVKDALQAGAIGYISKTGSIDEVVNAVRAAYRKSATLSADAMAGLLASVRQTSKFGYNLTKQERKVLKLLVEGFSNRDIADALVVSLSTAKAHVGNILSKLNTKSRTTAITLALQHRILDNDEDA
jgi:NarL family two-component system response regulator LiaR